MTYLRVLLFVTLAVREIDCVQPDLPWGSPINFVYKDKDVLKLDVILQNVPPEAEHYKIFIQLDSCDSNNNTEKYMQPGPSCKEPAKQGTIRTNETIYITRELTEQSVILYIYLGNSKKTCSRKKIIYGTRDEHEDKTGNAFREGCLNKHDKPCKIIVNFGNKCEDIIGCTQSLGNLTCESTNKELPEDTVHYWYHQYRDAMYLYAPYCMVPQDRTTGIKKSVIGVIPSVKGKKTKYEMEYQKFDLTTYIFSEQKWTHFDLNSNSKCLKTEVVEIPFTANVFKRIKGYNVKHSKYYSERKPVIFNCSREAHTQIGWIDPTGNKVITYQTSTYRRNFEKTDNNSMLCCLHYNISTNEYETTIRRSVDDITVLIYKETEKQKKASTTHRGDNSQETRQTPASSNGSELEAPQSATTQSATTQSATPQTPKPHSAPPQSAPPQSTPPQSAPPQSAPPQGATPHTLTPHSTPPQSTPPQSATPQSAPPQSAPPQSDAKLSDNTKYYIAITSVAGIILLIFLIYVVIKKCHRKSSDPVQAVQLETYASTDAVLYAELDVTPRSTAPPPRAENSNYAVIVGEIRPKNYKK